MVGAMRTEALIDVLEERRRIAARLFERNMSSQEIAEVLEVHPQTVRAWRRVYQAGGWEALKAKPHLGPRCKLTDEQKQEYLELLQRPPSAYGYGEGSWTTRRMARLIRDRFDVDYSHDHVGVIMHELGYSLQMPAKQARERDEARIAAWVEQTWPQIVVESLQRESVLVFVDEAGYSMIPTLKRTWAPKGRTPVVRHRNRWFRKVSVIGGISVGVDRAEIGLSMHWHPGEHVDQAKAVAFLEALVEQHVEPLDIVWDNLAAHGGKLIRAFLETHPQVRLHRLPPYAPELNPVEGIWSLTKYHRMANHEIDDLDTLHARALETVADVAAQPRLLHACIEHTDLADALWPSRGQ
jgi:transposase